MTILDFYEDLLHGLSLEADDEGLISLVEPEGDKRPSTIDGKRLVLPTEALLRSGFGSDLQPFHPFSESLSRKAPSPVLDYMRRVASALIATHVTHLATVLMEAAADPAIHNDLSPKASEYLALVPNATKDTVEKLTRLLRKAHTRNALLTFFLRNGGNYEDTPVSRLCVIRFPFMQALIDGEASPYGVKLKKVERETILALMQHILPDGDENDTYSAGTNSKTAPFLTAFLQAYRKITVQLNKINRRYRKELDIQLPLIDQGYAKHLEHFDEYYSSSDIPSLPGNEGGRAKGETDEPSVQAAQNAKVIPPRQPINRQPPPFDGGTIRPRSDTVPPTQLSRDLNPSDTDSMEAYLESLRPKAPPPPQYPNYQTDLRNGPHYGQSTGPYIPSHLQRRMAMMPQQQVSNNPYDQLLVTHQVAQGPQHGHPQQQQGGYPPQGSGGGWYR